MKRIYLVLFLVTVTIFLPIKAQETLNCDGCGQNVILKAQILSTGNDQLTLKLAVTNTGSEGIYLITDPVDQQGQDGLYLSLDDNDASTLVISSQLYQSPIPTPYANSTRVKLLKLSKPESYDKVVTLKFPLKESMPPSGTLKYHFESGKPVLDSDGISLPKQIEMDKIKSIKVTFGYFINDPATEAYLLTNPKGLYIRGNETVKNVRYGEKKSFLDLQNLVSTTIGLDKR